MAGSPVKEHLISRRLLEAYVSELTADRAPESYLLATVNAARSSGTAPSPCENRHAATGHEFFLVHEGRAKVATPGRDFILDPGQLLLVNRGVEHEELPVRERTPYAVSCFVFSEWWVGLFRARYSPATGHHLEEAIEFPGAEELESVLAAMASELVRRQPGWPEATHDLMHYVRRVLLRRVQSGACARQPAARAATPHTWTVVDATLRFVEGNLSSRLRLSDIAPAVGYSPRHLSRMLSEHLGAPFSQYLRDLRIGVAADLLVESDLPVTAIAEQVGYRDSCHFARAFRHVTGVSPRAYRTVQERGERVSERCAQARIGQFSRPRQHARREPQGMA